MNTKQIIQNMEKEWRDYSFSHKVHFGINADRNEIWSSFTKLIPSLLSAFAEEVIQGIDTQNEYLLQEAHKKCTTNDFSNGAFWAHKTMQKILSDQRLKAKEIIESIDNKCPNCGNGKDIDRWSTISQTQMYWKDKPGKSPIVLRSVCPVCGKAKEIISSIEK